MCWSERQISLVWEDAEWEFCSGGLQIAFMHYSDKSLEIKLVIDFACFAFVAREKLHIQPFDHVSSVQFSSVGFVWLFVPLELST